MTHEICEYYRNCDTYLLFKADTHKIAGLHEPLPIPNQPWQYIHIDFTIELSGNDGYMIVMTPFN